MCACVFALAWRAPLSAGATPAGQAAQASMAPVRLGDFAISYDGRGLSGLAATRDPYGTQVLAPGGRLGVMLKYRVEGGDWLDLYQNNPVLEKPAAGTVVYTNDVNGTALKSAQTFQTDGRVLDWTIDVANGSGTSTSRPRCSSGSSRIRQPPGPPRPLS